MTTTFYFPSRGGECKYKKKEASVNGTGHDLDVSFL